MDPKVAAACAAAPNGGVQGISGSLGGIGGPTGALEIVTNYRTGQVSGFAAGGVSVGWNGGASASGYQGYAWGLAGDNSNYKGGFTSATISAGSPIAHVGPQFTLSSSSGGVTGTPQQMMPNGQVTTATVGLNASIIAPPVSVNAAVTNYTAPSQIGNFMLMSPGNIGPFALNQVCAAIGD